MKIYMPDDSTYNKCYVVQSEGVIRGYDRIPNNNTNYNYRDYYIKSNYIYRDGIGQWNQYSTLPICLSSSDITNNFYYRNDFDSICIVFMTCFFFIFIIPWLLYKRIFRRGL